MTGPWPGGRDTLSPFGSNRLFVVKGDCLRYQCFCPHPGIVTSGLAGLAILCYLPFASLPLISDDYVQIGLARLYGPVTGLGSLAQDVLYRCRATSLWLTYWIDGGSILVFLLGRCSWIGWRISWPAAVFFAIYEGHQEAVVWSAALPELLVFFFALLCLLFWLGVMETRRWWPGVAAFPMGWSLKKHSVTEGDRASNPGQQRTAHRGGAIYCDPTHP